MLPTGAVAWIKSLKGEATGFFDVDATPIVLGETVYATSSAGGAFAFDRSTGVLRWRLPLEGAGPLATDGQRLYLAAANQGVYALDLRGNIIWRQGPRGAASRRRRW